jgi:hypothetical protein
MAHRSALRLLPVVALVLGLVQAAPAQAATCATVQSELNAATNGTVVTLQGICNMQVTLPNFGTVPSGGNANVWTLRGDPADGPDGFDGTGLPGRVMTGLNIHRAEIQDLVFRDSSVDGEGGAVSIGGDSAPAFRGSTFTNNHATGDGGAIYLEQNEGLAFAAGFALSGDTFGSETNAALGNSAGGDGGAVAFEVPGQGQNPSINTSLFANNVADGNGGAYSWSYGDSSTSPDNVNVHGNRVVGNTAGRSGGGGYIWTNGGGFLRIDQEVYEGNRISEGLVVPEGHYGGGLYVRHPASFQQRNNVFADNVIEAISSGEDYGGGGQAIFMGSASGAVGSSQVSRFSGNSIPGQPNGSIFESEGGGLYLSASGGTYHGWLDVLAANEVGANGSGGGAYAGANGGAHLEFSDSTIAGNSAPQFPGLSGGGGQDTLELENSIVFNSPSPDIGGFATVSSTYSDACQSPGTPFPGTGNICADPRLVDPRNGDIHQTPQSPTIDKGNDAGFLEEEEFPCCDFEGDPRPTDGDGDGHTVDMGADETPANFVEQEPPPPPPPPPGTPQCADGVDNDDDGAVDRADPGCLSAPGESYNAADANEGDEGLRELVLCGRRPISLVRADVRGRRVVLSGLVGSQVAGRKVDLFVRYLGRRGTRKKLATVTPAADGQFTTRVKGPPRRLFKLARYQAQVAGQRSVELKLPQSLESTSIRLAGDTIVLRGRVDRPLLGRRNKVVIKRVLCGQYQTVGEARPNRRGVYVVRFPAPGIAAAALYRAESRVLARPGSERYVRQFARAVNITVTAQSG